MTEFIAKGFALHLIADHPWILWIVGVLALMWVAERIIEGREERAALRAKRQEAVDLIAGYRDRVARGSGRP